jgi:8-amino-7-oxononanoate synthase
MNTGEDFLLKKLNERKKNGLIRSLNQTNNLIDFCSNDYLGFSKSNVLKYLIEKEASKMFPYQNGSTGSRLITGNHIYIEETETYVAKFHHAQAGLIFNSGYDANIGLLSALPQRGDTIIIDELIHASLIDGARLSHAERYKFKHNDLSDLAHKLELAKGNIYVVVESVYSMDGDLAPLQEINSLCKKYHANLIVDEAHATGVFGKNGQGLVCELGLANDVFARIVTFGKAIGVRGAIVLGSFNLRNYLINFARSFIYTTAPPLHNVMGINCAYQLLEKSATRQTLKNKIELYNHLILNSKLSYIKSKSSIQTILFSGNNNAKTASKFLHQNGFNVKAILSPTVAAGKERLRICLHSFNTDKEIEDLIKTLNSLEING